MDTKPSSMKESFDRIESAIEQLEARARLHAKHYGHTPEVDNILARAQKWRELLTTAKGVSHE